MAHGVKDLFYRFTIDSIGEIAFGVDLQALRGGIVWCSIHKETLAMLPLPSAPFFILRRSRNHMVLMYTA